MSEASRPEQAPFYPAFLDVRGARCVVVGGGRVAARKAAALVEAGAQVAVVSPRISGEIESAATSSGVEVRRKRFEPSDLDGALLAIAATNDPAVNDAVSREARARGILVNVVDQPALSSFLVPATVSRGRLQVAISTSGASPAFAKRLRERIERLLSPRLAAYLERMAEARALVIEQVADAERRAGIFEALASDELVGRYLEAEPKAADAMLMQRARELIARAGDGG
jgi:precorrin-2 dehydrogenase/sirohydrochlorin ferrochelatase